MLVDFGDWMIENMFFFWLIIAIFFLILEMGSPGLFFFLSFFFGAFFCAVATFFTNSLIVQSVVFLIGTAIAFVVLQYFVRSRVFKYSKHEITNVYALKGKRGKVLRCIEPDGTGLVKVLGEVWSARTHDDAAIKRDEHIIVVDIKGAHLVVKKIDEVVDKSKLQC